MKCAGPGQDGWPVTGPDAEQPSNAYPPASDKPIFRQLPTLRTGKDSSGHRRLHERSPQGADRRTTFNRIGGSRRPASPFVQPDLGLPHLCVDELPSVALTQRFLALCEHHGSQHLAVKLVAVGRSTGVPGLPQSEDWTTWDARQMRAAVEYLERLRVR